MARSLKLPSPQIPSRVFPGAKDAYLRGRLYLGMLAVGSWVMCSVFLLTSSWLESCHQWLIQSGAPEITALSLILCGFYLLQAPLDWLGGYWLPRRCGMSAYISLHGYGVAVLKHAILLMGSITTLHLVGRHAGLPAAWGVLIFLLALGVQSQHVLARWLGNLESTTGPKETDLFLYMATDPAFSGGISGWPGRERIIVNQAWQGVLKSDGMVWLKERRRRAVRSGLRMTGLLWAIAWISLSFVFAALLAGFPGDDGMATLRLLLYGVFFHFGGLLLLPTLSRRGSIALDRSAPSIDNQSPRTRGWIASMTLLTDGEEQRSPWIERIFHPLPSMTNRLSPQVGSDWGAWNATRYMLFLSTLAGGLLSRSVHCNLGRPELWIMPPVD
jgi:hypothetical protein